MIQRIPAFLFLQAFLAVFFLNTSAVISTEKSRKREIKLLEWEISFMVFFFYGQKEGGNGGQNGKRMVP